MSHAGFLPWPAELAQRYRLRPDNRDEIRSRLQEELSQRLIGIAKR